MYELINLISERINELAYALKKITELNKTNIEIEELEYFKIVIDDEEVRGHLDKLISEEKEKYKWNISDDVYLEYLYRSYVHFP